jgi:hypothetical protein
MVVGTGIGEFDVLKERRTLDDLARRPFIL